MSWAEIIRKLGQFIAAPRSVGLGLLIRLGAEVIARIIKRYYDEKARTAAIYADARKKAAEYAVKIIGKKTTVEERLKVEADILGKPYDPNSAPANDRLPEPPRDTANND